MPIGPGGGGKTYNVFTASENGLVPAPGVIAGNVLFDDATWGAVATAPNIQDGTYVFGVDGGVAGEIEVALSPALTSYQDGQLILVQFTQGLAGSITININVNSIGSVPVLLADGITPVTASALIRENTYAFLYSSSLNAFILLNPSSVFQGALVYQTTAQSILNAVLTAVLFDTESYKTQTAMHSTLLANQSKLICPQTGHVRISGQVTWTTTFDTFQLILYKNGAALVPVVANIADFGTLTGGQNPSFNIVSPVLPVDANDYFELYVEQNSGANQSLITQASWMQLEYCTL